MRSLAIAVASLTFACGSSRPTPGNYDVSPDAGAAVEDAGNDSGGGNGDIVGGGRCAMPKTVHATISGVTMCSCLNGTFALVYDNTESEPLVWRSAAIEGCAAQTFVRFKNDPTAPELSIGDISGGDDDAPATSATCSPLAIVGGGSTAGNINGICQGGDDTNMKWTVGP